MRPTSGHIDVLSQSQDVGGGSPTRSNPFCTRFVRPGAIAFRFDSSRRGADGGKVAARLVEELEQRRWGLVVGEHGSGKSTLIQTLLPGLNDRFCDVRTIQTHAPTAADLAGRLAQRRRTSAAVIRAAKGLAPSGLMIVDGLEQLGLASRFRLMRIARSRQQYVLATSHRELWPFATLFRTEVTSDLIHDLTETLVADESDVLRRAVKHELQTRPLTTLQNVRELWFDLYDVAETLRAEQDEPASHRE